MLTGLLVGIEILLSALLEDGSLGVTEIWVYCRVVEDVIDTVLMRSRAEADLATLHNDVQKLEALAKGWTSTTTTVNTQLPCSIGDSSSLQMRNLTFQRGQTTVSLQNLTIATGQILAMTGPNGCGKSTTFGLLSAGACTLSPVPLSEGIAVAPGGVLQLPGNEVVQLTQQSYCPLFSRPVEWFQLRQAPAAFNQSESKAMLTQQCLSDCNTDAQIKIWNTAERVAELANQLQFYEPPGVLTSEALLVVEENWYHSLSGGQRSKADFIKTVFLRDRCPNVLLIDEGFAALDPKSKSLVQQKLKVFCKDSLVMVIYHTDHDASSTNRSCVPPGFFDNNLHFANGSAMLRDLC